MKTFLTVTIFGILGWFVWKNFVKRERTEVDESFDLVREGQARSAIVNLTDLMRTPPVCTIGTRPLTMASVDPFSGVGPVGETQFLPRFASGSDNGATMSLYAEPAEPLADSKIPTWWLAN